MEALSGASGKRRGAPRRRVRALLLAALLLSGCVGLGREPAPVDIECVGLGSWWQPELYDAFAVLENVTHHGPRESLPFLGEDVGPRVNLSYFGWRSRTDSLFLVAQDGVRFSGMLAPARTREEAAVQVDAFLAKVSSADEAARRAVFESFWASRRPGEDTVDANGTEQVVAYSFDVPLDLPLRLDALWKELDEAGRARIRVVGSGMHAQWPGWEARVEYPERRVVSKGHDQPLVLYASGGGRARAMAPDYADEAAAQSRIREAFARLRILEPEFQPQPRFDQWERDGGIC